MKRKYKYLRIVIVLVLCLLLFKAVLFLLAKPKLDIDYIAKINALSRPVDYNPNKDGFKYLVNASELYIKAPIGINWELWPHEMNDVSLSLLKQWIADNFEALDTFKKATECSYMWIQLDSAPLGGIKTSVKLPQNESNIRKCLLWHAKLKASMGDFKGTLEDMVALWKNGNRHINPNYPLSLQVSGLSDRENIINVAVKILDIYRPAEPDLQMWQQQWAEQFNLDSYVPGLEAEKLSCYDKIQRAFVHKRDGSGRMYWRYLTRYLHLCHCEDSDSIFDILLIPTTGSTASEVYFQVDSMITRYNEIVRQYPWDVRYREQKYIKFQETYNKTHILEQFIPSMLHSFTLFYHRVNMKQDALITILAILRFQSQHGQYPSNLEEIVQEGFLPDLPRDVFSRGPLLYNSFNDDFELYSVGRDFADDGGKIYQAGYEIAGSPYGDEVFWPPLRQGRKNLKFIKMKELSDDGR